MTALLAIDCWTGRVRRYQPRRPGGRLIVTDEVRIITDPDIDTLKTQLEAFRAAQELPESFPQDHIPAGAA